MPGKKRRLSELFITGKKIVFDDGAGDPVEVWLQKLSEPEIEEAALRAGALRAVELRHADNHDSPKWLTTWSEVRAFGDRKVLVDIIVRDELAEYRAQTEAELMSLPEWAGEDDNMMLLLEAWEGNDSKEGLKDVYARKDDADPRWEDAVAVYDTIQRFDGEVEKIVEGERDRIYRDFEGESDEKIHEECTKLILERRAGRVFLSEFNIQQVFFATREPDKKTQQYFADVDEIRFLPDLVRDKLIAEYQMLEVEPSEGKGSPATPDSSPSSERAETVETAGSSGPAVSDG